VNTDFAILKDTKVTKISEAFNVQFRAELFNIFNHTNLGLPNLTLFTAGTNGGGNLNPNAGRITATTTSSRQIQTGAEDHLLKAPPVWVERAKMKQAQGADLHQAENSDSRPKSHASIWPKFSTEFVEMPVDNFCNKSHNIYEY
jgi:hypothetical protein